MSSDATDLYVLTTGVSLPMCCCAPSRNSTSCIISSSSSRVLPVQRFCVKSAAGLIYMVWKCTSSSSASSTSCTVPLIRTSNHSLWISQCRVCLVQPALPSASKALGRSPHDSIFEVDNPRVALWNPISGSMGRFTIAKTNIHRGERVFDAAAFAVLVRQSLVSKRCHSCFAKLRGKAFQCGACKFARYCSRACLNTDATLHDFQCQALHEVARRQVQLRDVETVRLVLAVLSMEQLVRNPQSLQSLAAHRQIEDSEEAEMKTVVSFIVQQTRQVLDPQHVRITLERVRCNAHPLYLDGITCVGTGVFPEAAMALNHSCIPNVAPSFDPHTRTLIFHAISEIPQGCAVEYAYIDLMQTRTKRRLLLSSGFGFDCHCERCTIELACCLEDDTDEQQSRAMEQLMEIVSSDRNNVKQQLFQWKKEHKHMIERSSETQFALYTAKMQLARTQSDWIRVMTAAERLLDIWRDCGLPECYHTTETLYLQIYIAATQAKRLEKANASAQKVEHIRRICGYLHPEARFHY